MNSDSGKLHNVSEDLRKIFGRVNPQHEETVEELLARATKRHADLADGEPIPGSDLPADWPIVAVGQELKQIKGWKLVVDRVDVEDQTIHVKLQRRVTP